METITSIKPLLAVTVSLIAAILIVMTKDNPNRRESCSIGAAAIKFLIILSMAPAIFAGKNIELLIVTILPGLSIEFRVDALGLMFALTASFLWVLTSFYSIGYMRTLKEHAQTRYYCCFAITLSATIGAAFAANLFTLFLFYEIITLVTYPLVAHKETPEAYEGSGKYLWYLIGTSKVFLLPAVILTFVFAGTLDFKPGGIFLGEIVSQEKTVLTVVFFLFIFGFAKAAVMPFHNWLPSAMVAPTPVSALLHAVAVVKVGVFSIVRMIYFIFGPETLQTLNVGITTAYIASFTIIISSVIALTKDNLKARLAYSTISQLSYIVLGMAMLSASGMTGGMIHITNHAFSKITLFFCAGAIYVAAHKTKISELNGIARKMPWTMTAFSIGAMNMIGMPLFAGFVSKWYLALGSIESKHISLLIVLIVSSILNACYFLPIIYAAFFKELPEGESPEKHEAPIAMVVPLTLTAIGTLLLFFNSSTLIELANLILSAPGGGN